MSSSNSSSAGTDLLANRLRDASSNRTLHQKEKLSSWQAPRSWLRCSFCRRPLDSWCAPWRLAHRAQEAGTHRSPNLPKKAHPPPRARCTNRCCRTKGFHVGAFLPLATDGFCQTVFETGATHPFRRDRGREAQGESGRQTPVHDATEEVQEKTLFETGAFAHPPETQKIRNPSQNETETPIKHATGEDLEKQQRCSAAILGCSSRCAKLPSTRLYKSRREKVKREWSSDRIEYTRQRPTPRTHSCLGWPSKQKKKMLMPK